MQYVNYDELIIQKYGVKLQGWTFEKLINPSQLSTSLPTLRHLLDAINDGNCKFVKLSPLEVKSHRQELQQKQDDGTVPVKTRKGKKKAASENDDEEEDDEDEEEQPRKHRKVPKSMETVPEDSDD